MHTTIYVISPRGRLLQPTGLKMDRAAVPPSKDLDPEVRKALREFLVASLDGCGDSPHVVDFAIRGRAPMMIGEDIMPQCRGRR